MPFPVNNQIERSQFGRAAAVCEAVAGGEAALAIDEAERVAALIRFFAPAFRPALPCGPAMHLGAVLADAALQAAVNYETVVRPRVTRIIREYPAAATRRGLEQLLSMTSAAELLRWRHPEKPRRFEALLDVCAKAEVDTVADLGKWLGTDQARPVLLGLPGVGPKTVDYLQLLAGHSVIPVDRHFGRLLRLAAVPSRDYASAQRTLTLACEVAGLPVRPTESALWHLFRDCSR